jgi:hypothetical protein
MGGRLGRGPSMGMGKGEAGEAPKPSPLAGSPKNKGRGKAHALSPGLFWFFMRRGDAGGVGPPASRPGAGRRS